jgi:glycerophosphoryl diester phosphodiesterase
MSARRSAGLTTPHQGSARATLDRSVFLRPIAHRGLHAPTGSRIENTEPAFQAAIDKGFGIECDLQPASDGTPMVFHDEKLDRLVRASGPIAARAPAQLARLRYRRHASRILHFTELLELVDGRVPLLVEIKAEGKDLPPAAFLDKIARQARAYKGPIALMSFSPDVVAAAVRLAPTIPRGLVVGSHKLPPSWWAAPSAANRARILTRRLSPAPDGISFLAIDVRMLAGVHRWVARHMPDLALFSWTIRTARQRTTAARWADAPIFEGPDSYPRLKT